MLSNKEKRALRVQESQGKKPVRYTNKELIEETQKYIEETTQNLKLPTIEGLAIYCQLNPKTLYERANKSKSVRLSLDLIKDYQKEKLVNKGLTNKYNANLTKFLLMNNHGMSEKSENKNMNISIEVQSFTPEDNKWYKNVINGQVIEVNNNS